jgi:hypothetical protein
MIDQQKINEFIAKRIKRMFGKSFCVEINERTDGKIAFHIVTSFYIDKYRIVDGSEDAIIDEINTLELELFTSEVHSDLAKMQQEKHEMLVQEMNFIRHENQELKKFKHHFDLQRLIITPVVEVKND